MTATLLSEPLADQRTESPQAEKMRVAYVMSRFPKISETFVFREINAVKARGVEVEIFPLLREKVKTLHPEVEPLVKAARFSPILNWQIVLANLYFLVSRPGLYLSTWRETLRAAWGSRRFFMGAVIYFPKAVFLSGEMSKLNIEHIHAHFASFPAAVALVIHRLTGIPFSFTAHGSDLHRDRTMLREKIDACAFAVSISHFNRNVIVDECGEFSNKLPIVHCGIDASIFRKRTGSTNFDLGHGPLQVTCTGTLHEVKGQTYLLQACAALHQKGVDFECHLLGDGPDREMLESLASELEIDNRVHFHGICTAEQVRDLVTSSDIYVCPSVPSSDGRREGIPVALMEAMACGIPCVASRLSGIPELIEHEQSGLLFQPGDAAGLADQLLRIANNKPLRQQLSQSGVEKVRSEFDLHDNVDRLISLFQKVIHSHA